MRNAIIDTYSARIASFRDRLAERCDQETLLTNARRIYATGGVPLPSFATKDELVGWLIFGAQRLFAHAVEQRLWFIGDFEEERARTEEAARLAYESWESLFYSWCDFS
jgi:hypothetical protein